MPLNARRRQARVRPGAAAAAAVLAMLAPVALEGCSPSRVIEAAQLLGDVAAGAAPSRFKRATPEPTRVPVTYRVAGRRRNGDIYRPGEDAKAMLVLVPGVARTGKDDPRLVQFARTLARARFQVLVPDIENLRALKVSSTDAREIADAVRYLVARGDGPPRATVGIVAISYAAGPAVLAALEHDTRERVQFVLTVGGYYDLEAVIAFSITGQYRDPPHGAWRRARPNVYGKWVFVQGNAERMTDPVDRAALAEMAARKLRDPDAGIGDLVARLRAEGRALHALLVNDRPENVPGLIAKLPSAVRKEVAALDLKTHDLSKLEAKLILIHGSDDAVIPASQSKALAAAAPEGRADLFVVDSLSHVDVQASGLFDTMTLWNAAYRLLEERDRMTPPAGR